MNEISESINRKKLVIQKQIDRSTEIKIMMEKTLRKNIQIGEYKDIIRSNVGTIAIQMGLIEHYKKDLKDGHLSDPFNILKETNMLRSFEQETRKKFQVPDSIPVIYK